MFIEIRRLSSAGMVMDNIFRRNLVQWKRSTGFMMSKGNSICLWMGHNNLAYLLSRRWVERENYSAGSLAAIGVVPHFHFLNGQICSKLIRVFLCFDKFEMRHD